jgi:hypothetical protein
MAVGKPVEGGAGVGVGATCDAGVEKAGEEGFRRVGFSFCLHAIAIFHRVLPFFTDLISLQFLYKEELPYSRGVSSPTLGGLYRVFPPVSRGAL